MSRPWACRPGRRNRSRRPTGVVTFAIFLAFSLSTPAITSAVEPTPFRVANRSPVVQVYGLPPVGEATLLPAGEMAAVLSLDVASNFTEHTEGAESILLDGETYRVNFTLRRGIGQRAEVSLELPWISHRRGSLDGFIEDWHDTFNLPGGGREDAPSDRLLYRYVRNGRELLRLDESAEGFGDLRIGGAWQLVGGRAGNLALRGSLKLPTGDDDRLLGSGGTDLALWLTGSRRHSLDAGPLVFFGGAGLLLPGKGNVLPGRQRDWVAFGTFGTGFAPREWIAFKLQFDGHSAFYHSALDELGAASVQLTLGGTLGFSEALALDLGVSEDIVVNTSPDVVFHLALRQTF